MKNKLGVIALALWVATIGTFAVYFVKGSTAPSTDHRRAINLTPQERDLVLGEMRTMLEAVDGTLGALADGDLKRAATAARTGGMVMAVDASPLLVAKLPLDFKELGMGTHKAFDQLGKDIENGMPVTAVLKNLNGITNRCVSCHQGNRFAN